MPFKRDLRRRLQDLKSEYDTGLLPASLYEEMCRRAIAEHESEGQDVFESSGKTIFLIHSVDLIQTLYRRCQYDNLVESNTKRNTFINQ